MRRDDRILDHCRVKSKRKATAARIRKVPKRIRLLIADDHVLILEGLAAAIGRQDDMTVVATASDGRQAFELWKMHRPDVSLLDLRMRKIGWCWSDQRGS